MEIGGRVLEIKGWKSFSSRKPHRVHEIRNVMLRDSHPPSPHPNAQKGEQAIKTEQRLRQRCKYLKA